MKIVKKQPITGAQPQYSKKKPMLPDAKETSSDEQKFISEAPTPFKHKMQLPGIPAASAAPGGVSTLEPKIQSGLKRTSPGVKALPSGGPIGQKTMPNQSKQIGGRMSAGSSQRKIGAYPSGYKAKKGAAFYGE